MLKWIVAAVLVLIAPVCYALVWIARLVGENEIEKHSKGEFGD